MANTEKKILDIQNAFMKLYANSPIHEISVKKLCEEIGITRTAFYYYYSDIYEVLESIEDKLIADLKEINQSFCAEDFYQISKDQFVYFFETLEYIKEHSAWFRILLNRSKDGPFIHKWKRIINDDFSRKYRRERIRLENEPLVLEMISSGVIGVYTYWVNHLDEVSKEIVAKEVLYRLCRDFITDLAERF